MGMCRLVILYIDIVLLMMIFLDLSLCLFCFICLFHFPCTWYALSCPQCRCRTVHITFQKDSWQDISIGAPHGSSILDEQLHMLSCCMFLFICPDCSYVKREAAVFLPKVFSCALTFKGTTKFLNRIQHLKTMCTSWTHVCVRTYMREKNVRAQ